MYPPCENVARFILPIYRSFIARELVEKYNYTQVEAAKKLGTTQAAISQYVHSKRGFRGIPYYEEILPIIQNAATETAKRIATEEISVEETIAGFCRLCTSFREKTRKT